MSFSSRFWNRFHRDPHELMRRVARRPKRMLATNRHAFEAIAKVGRRRQEAFIRVDLSPSAQVVALMQKVGLQVVWILFIVAIAGIHPKNFAGPWCIKVRP